jgi:hypothetical protein
MNHLTSGIEVWYGSRSQTYLQHSVWLCSCHDLHMWLWWETVIHLTIFHRLLTMLYTYVLLFHSSLDNKARDLIQAATIMQDKMLNSLPDLITFVKSDEETSGFQKLLTGEKSIQAYWKLPQHVAFPLYIFLEFSFWWQYDYSFLNSAIHFKNCSGWFLRWWWCRFHSFKPGCIDSRMYGFCPELLVFVSKRLTFRSIQPAFHLIHAQPLLGSAFPQKVPPFFSAPSSAPPISYS